MCRYIPVESALCLAPVPAHGDSRVARLQRHMAQQLEERCVPAAGAGRAAAGDVVNATLVEHGGVCGDVREEGPWPVRSDGARSNDDQVGVGRTDGGVGRAEVVRIRVVFPPEEQRRRDRCCAVRQQHKGHIQFLESEEMAHLLLHAAVLPSLQPD